MAKKLIVAHRGASAYAPENTLGSFELAIEQGADMIEFDVRRTRDQIFVLNHEPDYLGRFIDKLTYQELEDMSNAQVPTLKQVLEFTQGRVKLDVEFKEIGYERQLLDIILEYFSLKDFIITSFNPESIEAVKVYDPNISAGLILGRVKGCLLGKIQDFGLFKNRAICVSDFLAVNYSRVKCGLVKSSFYKGKPLYVWTVNSLAEMQKLLDYKNVVGIITDKPDVALKVMS